MSSEREMEMAMEREMEMAMEREANAEGGVPSVAAASFPEVSLAEMSAGEMPLSMLMDLKLPISIELGRASMTVQEILRLGRGSVVQLERLAGEPVDIYVGDRRFAEGEVVVLGEYFGVRISRILAAAPPVGAPA